MIGYEEAPRYAAAVLALTGDREIVPPGITLETDRPEYSVLKREILWHATQSLNASPANFSSVLITNGGIGSSQRLQVLTHIIVNQNCLVGLTGGVSGLAAGNRATQRDDRAAIPQMRLFTRQTAASIFTAGQGTLFIPANLLYPLPAFISRSDRIGIETTIVNQAVIIYLAGYERACRPEEAADQ